MSLVYLKLNQKSTIEFFLQEWSIFAKKLRRRPSAEFFTQLRILLNIWFESVITEYLQIFQAAKNSENQWYILIY